MRFLKRTRKIDSRNKFLAKNIHGECFNFWVEKKTCFFSTFETPGQASFKGLAYFVPQKLFFSGSKKKLTSSNSNSTPSAGIALKTRAIERYGLSSSKLYIIFFLNSEKIFFFALTKVWFLFARRKITAKTVDSH